MHSMWYWVHHNTESWNSSMWEHLIHQTMSPVWCLGDFYHTCFSLWLCVCASLWGTLHGLSDFGRVRNRQHGDCWWQWASRIAVLFIWKESPLFNNKLDEEMLYVCYRILVKFNKLVFWNITAQSPLTSPTYRSSQLIVILVCKHLFGSPAHVTV